MSEIDWNTPVVDRTLTANETQLLPQQVQAIAAGTTVSGIPSANHFVYFAAFDGTNNNRDNLSLAGDAQETNIGFLERRVRQETGVTSGLATQYFPGPGTELSRINSDWAPPKVTAEVVDIAQRAYIDYAEKAQAWLQSPNPNNEVRTLDGAAAAVTGFSRGCAAAVVFAQMLHENGLIHPDGTVLIPKGHAGVAGMALIDPVYTGVVLDLSISPNVSAGNIVVVQALDEFRTVFKAADYSNDSRVRIVEVFGNHCDLGGCYSDQGIGALTLVGLRDFFINIGLPVAAIPPDRMPNAEASLSIHNSAVDINGNEIWSTYGFRPVDSISSSRLFDDITAPHPDTHYNTAVWDFVTSSPWLFAISSSIDKITSLAFEFAREIAPALKDPLTLDLDGNGLDTTGIDPTDPILFDHDGDGIKTATGWVGAGDAFLVLDRNGNNTIDTGRELFGDSTPLYAGGLAADGFAALAQEDSNADGRVNASDTRYAQLRLWQDLNQDGISQSGELKTLAQAGIAALIVAKTENAVLLPNGNQIADLGGYLRSDGSGGVLGATEQMADIDLASNPFYSEFADSIPLTEAAQILPDMKGAGQVRSLREAASLDTPEGQALAAELAAFAAETTRNGQTTRLNNLLKTWADTSRMATTATGAFAGVNLAISFTGVAQGTPAYQAWLDKLTILERFNGQTFLPVPEAGTSLSMIFYDTREALLDQSYQSLKDSVYGALALQTRLKPYLDSIALTIDDTGIALDYTAMTARLDAQKANDAKAAVMDLVDLQRHAGAQLSGWKGLGILGAWADDPAAGEDVAVALLEMGLAHGGYWSGGTGDDFAAGSAGTDTLYGYAGNDTLLGLAGNDTLDGGIGDDTMDGGAGNDRLHGSPGSDTYVFRRGSGYDTLRVSDGGTGKTDILLLDGLTPNDIRLEKWGDDLAFIIKDTGEWTRFGYFFSYPASEQLDAVRFGDGTTWNRAALMAQPFLLSGGAGNDNLSGRNGGPNTIDGHEGNDYLFGGDQADQLAGGSGNDNLYAGTGDDILLGDEGSDWLEAGDGNDVLDGGMGNDTLLGGAGSDTFVFRRGGGNDLVRANDSGSGKVDTLQLDGLSADDVRLEKWNNDLAFIIKDTGEWARVQDFFTAAIYQLDAVRFGDGTTWNRATLLAQPILLSGGAGNDNLYGRNGGPNTIDGHEGNDYLFGGDQADQLAGGSGNDTLDGGIGDDTMDGGAGNDRLYGSPGSDTYVFRRGSGYDTLRVSDGSTGKIDALQLDGLTPADIRLEKWGDDLAFIIKDTGEWARFGYFFSYPASEQLDAVRFGDGTTWNRAALMAQPIWLNGSSGNDNFIGGSGNDFYNGGDGNDTIAGNAGNDSLKGGPGIDLLDGGIGNDTLDGGPGNDTLTGGGGDDTYAYALGDGQDRIIESSGADRVVFGPGMSASNVAVSRNNGDLVLAISATDSIRFAESAPGSYAVEQVEFADGGIWQAADLLRQLSRTPPTVALPVADQTTSEDALFQFTLPANTFVDADASAGDRLSLTATLADGSPLPAWLSFDAEAHSFRGTPDGGAVGSLTLQVIATDLAGNSAAQVFAVKVENVNDAPAGALAIAGTASQGETLILVDTIADADGIGAMSYRWQSSGDGSVWSDLGGATDTSLVLAEAQVGLRIRAVAAYVDGHGTVETVISEATPVVVNINDAPIAVHAIADQSAAEGDAFSVAIPFDSFVDVDAGDSLAYAVTLADGSALPAWLGFDPWTGILSGTPPGGAAGSLGLTVTATDLAGASAAGSFTLTVTGGNHAPELAVAIADQSATQDLAFFWTVLAGSFIDSDPGDSLSFTATLSDGTALPAWLAFDAATASFSGMPGAADPGVLALRVTATDTGGLSAQADFSLAIGRHLRGTGSSDTLDYSASDFVGANLIDGGAGRDTITGSAGNDIIVGGAGSDTLFGGAGDDIFLVTGTQGAYDRFEGGDGRDVLQGSAGDDTFRMRDFGGAAAVERIDGMGGYDVIAGTGGADTLDFSATELAGIALIDGGAGRDVITGSAGDDIIAGGAGADTLFGGAGNDTFLVSGTHAAYDRFEGGDGRDVLQGSAGDDTFRLRDFGGEAAIERIDGMGGYDVIGGTGGADTLDFSATELAGIALIYGGAGRDVIIGSAGDDVIAGGAGIDTLSGGAGNDGYRLGRGDGVDTIVENDATPGNRDAAEFLAGIGREQIWLRHVGNNLEARIIGTSDKLIVQDWYLGDQYRVEEFRTADGGRLLDSQVENLVQAMAAFAPPGAGQTALPPDYQEALAPVIAANWQ